MKFDVNKLEWTREPKDCFITSEKIEIITKSHTDLWQRTYYHFRNDDAPVLQMETSGMFGRWYCIQANASMSYVEWWWNDSTWYLCM